MAMDVAKLRKLVALDEDDALSRFALGQALFSLAIGVVSFLIGLQLFRRREHLFLHYLS